MSAWVVTNGHIDILVQALAIEGLIGLDQAQAIGQKLWDENRYAVGVRYREDPEEIEYVFHGVEGPLDDAHVHAAIRCYHYQCMEWDGFEQEPGMQLVLALEKTILAAHPELGKARALFTRWGYDSIEQALA